MISFHPELPKFIRDKWVFILFQTHFHTNTHTLTILQRLGEKEIFFLRHANQQKKFSVQKSDFLFSDPPPPVTTPSHTWLIDLKANIYSPWGPWPCRMRRWRGGWRRRSGSPPPIPKIFKIRIFFSKPRNFRKISSNLANNGIFLLVQNITHKKYLQHLFLKKSTK